MFANTMSVSAQVPSEKLCQSKKPIWYHTKVESRRQVHFIIHNMNLIIKLQ